jgi:putative two-component system response regulator
MLNPKDKTTGNPRILVVDDNAELRKGLSLQLRAHGYDVLFAADAISATAAVVKQEPDLVILDLGLPCGDGFVVIERLQSHDHLSRIPIIVLTARESEQNRERALQAGAVAFLQKPLEDGVLLFAIQRALDAARGVSILVIDDNKQLQIAFKKMLNSAGYHVWLAGDGEEGLLMAQESIPDIIVLDLLLPKLSGVDVLRALKADPATERIPVIALSGLPRTNERELMRAGAVSYLEKARLHESEVLLQAIDDALFPRRDLSREEASLPHLST